MPHCDLSQFLRGQGRAPSSRAYMVVGVQTAKHVLRQHRKRFSVEDIRFKRMPSVSTHQKHRWAEEFLHAFQFPDSPGIAAGPQRIARSCPVLAERARKYWTGW